MQVLSPRHQDDVGRGTPLLRNDLGLKDSAEALLTNWNPETRIFRQLQGTVGLVGKVYRHAGTNSKQ